jgi:glycosyltransferase involved in cell wall biosynthesis
VGGLRGGRARARVNGMRIGLVIYGELASVSGGFLYDRMLVDELRRAGDEVDIISLPWRGFACGMAQAMDPRIRAMVRRWDGDLLLEDELAHPTLALLGPRRGIPRVAIVHHLRASEHPGRPARGIRAGVERAYLNAVDACVFNSETTRRTVRELVGCDVRGIVATPGGDRLGPDLTEEQVLLRCKEPGPLRVLFVGNLIPRKGLLTLLEALNTLPRERWALTVAGSREADPAHAAEVDRAVREHRMRDNVRMSGPLDDAALADAFRTHHVLAVPSRYEGFGIVYLEAMGFGVVPVGSGAGGAAEVIRHGRSGFLVEPGDAPALGSLLGSLAADRALLGDMAVAALRRFAELPGWRQSMRLVRDWLHGM